MENQNTKEKIKSTRPQTIRVKFKDVYELAEKYAIENNILYKGKPDVKTVMCNMYGLIGYKSFFNSRADVISNGDVDKDLRIPIKEIDNLLKLISDMHIEIVQVDTFPELLDELKKSSLPSSIKTVAAFKILKNINENSKETIRWTRDELSQKEKECNCNFKTMIALSRDLTKCSFNPDNTGEKSVPVVIKKNFPMTNEFFREHCEEFREVCFKAGRSAGFKSDLAEDFASEALLLAKDRCGFIEISSEPLENKKSILFCYIKKAVPEIKQKIISNELNILNGDEEFPEDKTKLLKDKTVNIEEDYIKNFEAMSLSADEISILCNKLLESEEYSWDEVEKILAFKEKYTGKRLDDIPENAISDEDKQLKRKFYSAKRFVPELSIEQREVRRKYTTAFSRMKRNIKNYIPKVFTSEEKTKIYKLTLDYLHSKDLNLASKDSEKVLSVAKQYIKNYIESDITKKITVQSDFISNLTFLYKTNQDAKAQKYILNHLNTPGIPSNRDELKELIKQAQDIAKGINIPQTTMGLR